MSVQIETDIQTDINVKTFYNVSSLSSHIKFTINIYKISILIKN